MSRVFGGIFIGLAGLLCLFGILDLLTSVAHYVLVALRFVMDHLGISSLFSSLSSGPTLVTMFVDGAFQNDPLFVKLLYYALKILLFLGLFVAIGLFSFKKNTLIYAKYWCYVVLLTTGLYVAGLLIAPFLHSFEVPSIAGYYSKKTGVLIEFGLQIILVVLATRLIDKDLNSGQV